MIRKLLLVSFGCLFAASALGAGACQGQACRYTYFGKDADGCLEIRNTAGKTSRSRCTPPPAVAITVRVAAGHTEKVYKTGRMCVPAVDYVRSDAEFNGGIFAPPR